MNPADEVSLKRVVNVPKRGVGDTSIARLDVWARAHGATFEDAMRHSADAGIASVGTRGIRSFLDLLDELRELVSKGPGPVLEAIIERTGYSDELHGEHSVEAEGRLENLAELVGSAHDYETVDEFLEQISLVADADEVDGDDSRVVLMTLHTAKGLEFPVVFLIGFEDGVFPHLRSLTEPDELEEERRLAYVGITRAKQRLFVTHAWSRSLFGSTQYNPPSRFLDEIPPGLLESIETSRRASGRGSFRFDGGGRRDGFSFADSARNASGRDRIVESAIAAGQRATSAAVGTTGAEQLGIRTGDDVRHAKYGDGVVLAVRGQGEKAEATVRFPTAGEKTFLLSWTPLQRV
jgi:DNA helicase-2/ATP-dependent DNA helicase PcrA